MIFDVYAEKEARSVCIYSSGSPVQEGALIDPKLHLEADTAGTFEFGIPWTNTVLTTNYGTADGLIERMATEFFVWRTLTKPNGTRKKKVIWRGRALIVSYDFYNTPSVHCEGALSFFNDTIQDKMTFEYKVDINKQVTSNPTAEEMLRAVIATHNRKNPRRAFQLPTGMNLTHDFEENLTKDNTFYVTVKPTLDILNELKSKFGGHFRVVYDEIDVNETDPAVIAAAKVPRLEWYATYNKVEDPNDVVQTVSFAKNLVDITKKLNGANIVNAVYPVGKVVNKGGSIAARRSVPVTCYEGIYTLTTQQPDDWATNYYKYFTLERSTYMPVPRTYKVPTWKANTYYKAKVFRYHVNKTDSDNATVMSGDIWTLQYRWDNLLRKMVEYYELNDEVKREGYVYRGVFRSSSERDSYFSGSNPPHDKDVIINCDPNTGYRGYGFSLYVDDGESPGWVECNTSNDTPEILNDIYVAGDFYTNTESVSYTDIGDSNSKWSHWFFRKHISYGASSATYYPQIDTAMNTRLIKDVNTGTSRPMYAYKHDGLHSTSQYYISVGGYWDSDQRNEDGIAGGLDFANKAFEVKSGETYYVRTRVGSETIPWAVTQWYLGRYPSDEGVYHHADSDGQFFRSLSVSSPMATDSPIYDKGYDKVSIPYPNEPLVNPRNTSEYLDRLFLNACSMTYMEDLWNLNMTGIDIVETREVQAGQDEHITLIGVDDGSYSGYIKEFTGADAYFLAQPALPYGWNSNMASDEDLLKQLKLSWFVEPGYIKDGWFAYYPDAGVKARSQEYPSRITFPSEGERFVNYIDLEYGKVYKWDADISDYVESNAVKTYYKENFYVVDKTSEEKYGRIEKVLELSDVDDPVTLQAWAAYYLYYGQFEELNIDVTALDLAIFKDTHANSPDVLDAVRVYSTIHNVDLILPVKSRDIPLNNLEDMSWTLGYETTRQLTSKRVIITNY